MHAKMGVLKGWVGLMRATLSEVNRLLVSRQNKYVVDLMARTTMNEPNPSVLLALLCNLLVSGAGLSKEGRHLLEIEPPTNIVHVGSSRIDINGRFGREATVTPIDCWKRVDSCNHLLLEGLVEAFNEAISLRMMIWGCKHQVET